MGDYGEVQHPFRLEPGLQHYAWGDPDFLPALLRLENPERRPYAELWLGAHPSLPSSALLPSGAHPLDRLIDQTGPALVGTDVVERFGRLPYLLKIIAAARPLSIQAHPSRAQAEEGYDREEARGIPLNAPDRSYRDRNHKPELVVAVTDFWALCGFRPVEEIEATLRETAELQVFARTFQPDGEGLRRLLERFLTTTDADADAALSALIERLRADDARQPFSRDDHRRWLLEADREFSRDGHRDRGLLAALLLNLVHLRPGEGLFLDAGVLHAYLSGVGVEVMASSDNVLRCGLTRKHVDVAELLRAARFDRAPPQVLTIPAGVGAERVYPTPAAEFELHRLALSCGELMECRPAHGGEILLALDIENAGTVAVRDGRRSLELHRGQACFVPHDVSVSLRATSPAVVFKATVPRRRTAASILRNIHLAEELLESGETPDTIGTVSGSREAQVFWQRQLDHARESFRCRRALSFHEDLPVNQALGVLLLWQRLQAELPDRESALIAFVFGEGTRAAPLTEAENAQKPAMATFATVPASGGRRYIPMVELALRAFVPVERHLRRSGFRGLVVKWGDEVQVPARDLSGADPALRDADVVRFVSRRAMTDDEARNKDWVGLGPGGEVLAFLPRRPLSEMAQLAAEGLVEHRAGRLWGGVNLGSVAVSWDLLDGLLEEFREEVNDPHADRTGRPDLDPQFFTALVIAARDDRADSRRAWEKACAESAALSKLERDMPGIIDRLRRVVHTLAARRGRPVRIVAMDFGDQYWGDIGQHRKIYEFYMALNDSGETGEIARALAGIESTRDARGNILCGDTHVGRDVVVRDSVLLNARVHGPGRIESSVLIGTTAGEIFARNAFDILSTASSLSLEPRSGTYRVVSVQPVRAGAGERWTTLFLPEGAQLLGVHEDTDLRDRAHAYDVPILGNAMSFRDAHEAMASLHPEELDERRRVMQNAVARAIGW